MLVLMRKRREYWNHFVAEAFVTRMPPGVTGPRLRKVRRAILLCDDFWWDIVLRHGGTKLTPEQLRIQDPAQYEHCMGNFWGVVIPSALKGRLVD